MSKLMARPVGLLLALVVLASGCGRGGKDAAAAGQQVAVLSAENIAVVQRTLIESGPRISGALEARRQAAVRAQIGGSIVHIGADPGQRVAAGQVLAQIEDRAVRDAQLSATSGVRAAEQAFASAERQANRTKALVEGGALAERDLDVALNALASARAQLDDARARLQGASDQVNRARVSAPFAGIVAERPVNEGDVVSPGTLVFTLVDPGSMRLAAAVPAAALGTLRVGSKVEFQVRGAGATQFAGVIERISPAADPTTRQIPIYVSIPNREGRLVAGLFADGRVASESRETLVVPASAIDESGDAAHALRVRGGKVEQVEVQLGIRDEQADRVEVRSGLSVGDTVVLGAARGLSPGSPVQIRRVDAAAR